MGPAVLVIGATIIGIGCGMLLGKWLEKRDS
jgi:hypothetical protein